MYLIHVCFNGAQNFQDTFFPTRINVTVQRAVDLKQTLVYLMNIRD